MICFFYNWYTPAYKAGGPIQSLQNLGTFLESHYQLNFICSNKDLNGEILNVKPNSWLNHTKKIKVLYSDTSNLVKWWVFIKKLNDSISYINGIYSLKFNLIPIIVSKKLIISPRGMLQESNINIKKNKKLIYLNILRYSGILNKSKWHATDEQEAKDIQKWFPKNNGIIIAHNIPKQPLKEIGYPNKKQNYLRLIFLSLIAEKKNLHLVLAGLSNTENISLDIYGPIKDNDYWKNQCLPLLDKLSDKVNYLGDILPNEVQDTISKYDALILLSKGENFGHAIYESLSVGRPVIISEFTPWKNLKEKKAGLNVDIKNEKDITDSLSYFKNINEEEFNNYCKGAHHLAVNYYFKTDFKGAYNKLFSFN